jgi:hypothetical protein
MLDQFQSSAVGELEHVLSPGQHGHEARRQTEQGIEEVHVVGQTAIRQLERLPSRVQVVVDLLEVSLIALSLLCGPHVPYGSAEDVGVLLPQTGA